MDSSIVTYFEDTDSRAVLVNEECAKLNLAVSAQDMVYTDATYYYKKESAYAHIADDRNVLKTKSLLVTGGTSITAYDTMIDFINIKLPWYQGDDIIGILGLTLDIGKNKLNELPQHIATLLTSGLFQPQQLVQIITSNANDIPKHNLTRREMEILLHLLKGISAKQSAAILAISKRTVENTIARIKDKSNCKSKYELIMQYSHLIA